MLHSRQFTGDTTYGTAENIVALEEQHIRAYVPLPDFDQRVENALRLSQDFAWVLSNCRSIR